MLRFIYPLEVNVRILIAGDSLSLPRPHQIKNFDPKTDKDLAVHFHETYGYLLQKGLERHFPDKEVFIINRSRRAFTIKDIQKEFFDHLHYFEPDMIVLHVGIVDCWFREGGQQFVNINEFSHAYTQILNTLKLKPQTKMIVIGIAPTSVKMDTRFPGLNDEINKYNKVYQNFIDEIQTFYIDMARYIDPHEPSHYLLPDHHHLNKEGNQLLYKKLFEICKSIF